MMSLISKPLFSQAWHMYSLILKKSLVPSVEAVTYKGQKPDMEVKLKCTSYRYVLICKLIKCSEPQCLHL